MNQQNIEYLGVKIDISDIDIIECRLKRVNAPLCIQKLENSLPIISRVIKRNDKLIFNTNISCSRERAKSYFQKGDIAIDSSSGNITIYLKESASTSPENLLGNIDKLPDFSTIRLTAGIKLEKI
ncbi:MAG: hypothetical protein OEZ01_00245 [Candidatus Heimdallarchaeota archaeon]|nr:hypothetical protein [Candidatus Heimdallarchaeota archaeon]MDH5644401.1 hypothetical protein [Candidatus Heimdallarchaeota archaeon]